MSSTFGSGLMQGIVATARRVAAGLAYCLGLGLGLALGLALGRRLAGRALPAASLLRLLFAAATRGITSPATLLFCRPVFLKAMTAARCIAA